MLSQCPTDVDDDDDDDDDDVMVSPSLRRLWSVSSGA